MKECRNNGPSTISLVLVGNKIDLENERQVSHEEGEEFAKKNNMLFFETSALSGKILIYYLMIVLKLLRQKLKMVIIKIKIVVLNSINKIIKVIMLY